jgi:hypothetical protein
MEMLRRRREDKNIDKEIEREEYEMSNWLKVVK